MAIHSDFSSAPAPIAEAVERLRSGGLVAFPTETVYGLGGDATNDSAVAQIFQAKERPRFNPLIIHVADFASAKRLAVFSDDAKRLAELYWPGPLSLVLPRQPDSRISLLASAGLDTIAIRIPAHPLAQSLLRAVGRPICAPSANRSGRLSPTTAADVKAELGDRVSFVLDGGPCRVGIESTILDLSGDRPILLRPGGIATEALSAMLGPIEIARPVDGDAARKAPGMLLSHYAPGLPIRLNAMQRQDSEAFIAFGAAPSDVGLPDGQLSETGGVTEAAARLFAILRAVDHAPFTGIAIMPIPVTGLGAAINDRLQRAAAPRA